MKRCEGGRGLISVKDCTISESNGLWDYLEKSEEAILKEVVKEDFMVEDFMVKEEGKKEYDRKTKERSEMNWKEKKLYRKFLKLIADFIDSVLRQWLRSGYIKRNADRHKYYCCSRSGNENKLVKSKQRWS